MTQIPGNGNKIIIDFTKFALKINGKYTYRYRYPKYDTGTGMLYG
jgi:hypothetical protein